MLILLAAITAISCAEPMPLLPSCEAPPAVRAIVSGAEDYTHEYVVKLNTFWNGHMGTCSGVVIGDKTVLTAAHCVRDTEIFVSDTLGLVGVSVRHVFLPLEDLALVYTVSSLGINPAKLPRHHSKQYYGCTVNTVGFGVDYDSPIRTRKSARSVLAGLTVAGYLTARQNDETVCYGDSGGPMLWGDVVIGILYGGTTDQDGKCVPDWAFYTDVFPHLDWILDNLDE